MSNDYYNRFTALRGLDGNTDLNYVLRGGKPSRSPRACDREFFFGSSRASESYAGVVRADAPRVPTGRTFGHVPHTAQRATPSVDVPGSSEPGAARAVPFAHDFGSAGDDDVVAETPPPGPGAFRNLTDDFTHAARKRTRSPTKRALSPKGSKRARAPASGRPLSPGVAARNRSATIAKTYYENRYGRQNREDDADDGNYYYSDDDFNEEETDAARTRCGFDFRAPDENENENDDDDDDGAHARSPPLARPTGKPESFPGASRTYATVRSRSNDSDAVRDLRTMCPTRRFANYERVRSTGSRARPGQYVDLLANMANEFNINKDAAQNYYKGDGVSAAAAAAAAANPETAQRAFASTSTGSLSTSTVKDYSKKWKNSFLPFFEKFCAPIRIPIPEHERRPGGPVDRAFTIADLTDNDVIFWVQFELIDKGKMSGASARQCLIAARGIWPMKMQMQTEGYRVQDHRNPFSTDAVRLMQKSLRKRMKKIDNLQSPRTALEPKFFAGILKTLIVVVDRFKACFGLDDYRVYMPHKFHFTEFELTRNMMAVMIGYMYGLRATNLFDLTLDDIKITMPERGVRTLTLKKQVCKNFCRNEFSEPRVFAPGQFSDIMAELFSVFLTMKRYMYSYRMIEQPSGDTMNPANFIPFDNKEALKTNFESAAELDAFLDRIDYAHVVSEGGRIWSIPGEYVTKDNATKVTSWLKSSLKRAELLDEATRDRKLSSHVIRSGAASAFVCVNPTLLVKAKFHFGWKLDSDVIEENYIAHSWTPRAHPEANFFWGDWKGLGY